jgi:4-hydroxy-tetrahydrodipicolinate reductase
MGRVLTEIIDEESNLSIVAGIDKNKTQQYSYPVFSSFSACNIKADVVIDFSHHSMTSNLVDYCIKTKTPAIICTTGLDDATIEKIKDASKEVPIFRSGNMSLGINLIIDLAKKATRLLNDSFDIEIIEKHHNKKVDSPSGTAYMIAQSINEELENRKTFTYGRYGRSTKRQEQEIGIHAIRGGTIVGEHTVIYAGTDEIIEIKHTAMSKKIFASGAIKAAKFLITKKSGLYNMDDLL